MNTFWKRVQACYSFLRLPIPCSSNIHQSYN